MDNISSVMNRKRQVLILICLVSVAISLSNVSCIHGKSQKNESVELTEDTSGNKKLYSAYQELSQQIKIEILNDKFDETQFRFWIHILGGDSSKLILLRKVSNEWVGKEYSFKKRFDENKNMLIDVSSKDLVPKGGWNVITQKLTSLDLDKFRYFKDIPGYNIGISTHCFELTLEYVQSGKHIILPYPCFEYYHKNVQEVTSLVNLINYIDSDADLTLPKIWYSFPWKDE